MDYDFFQTQAPAYCTNTLLILPMSGIIIQTVFDKKLMMFYSYLQDPDRTLHDWVIMSDDKRMEIDRGEQ